MAKILVTGGAGFIGSHLVDKLVEAGHDVLSVDNLSGGYMRNVSNKCKFSQTDLIYKGDVNNLVKEIDIVYHLAAYAAEGQSIFSPIAINKINIEPMNNLLVAAVNNGVKRFVFTSSMAVYGSQEPPFDEIMDRYPEDPYGAAKAYCENMLEIFSNVYDLEYVILRPHNVYGPRQNIADPYRNVLGIWINQIMRSKAPMIYGDGNQTRAFSYIDDVIPPMVKAGFEAKANGQIINVGSDEVVTINDAYAILTKAMNAKYTPALYEPARPEVKYAYCTVEKSKHMLDYKTKTNLFEGLTKMVAWAKSIGPQEPTYTFPLEIIKNAPKVWIERKI